MRAMSRNQHCSKHKQRGTEEQVDFTWLGSIEATVEENVPE